jgi:radical SAM superfamily enzyme YgiQ (UPF0313 family)
MERVEMKTSQLLMTSYLGQFFPVEYADFEITIGRANSPVQIKRYERKVREFLANRRFDILALSCWTSLSYQATLATARICRELFPEKLVVVGGYHASARPQEFVTPDNAIDYVICGEGELALKEIAEGFKVTGRPPETGIIKAPLFPSGEFVRINWNLVTDFFRSEFPQGILNVYLYLSRGCPFGCSFCMEPLKDRKWRSFSPQEAVAEMMLVGERFKPLGVAAADACFGLRSAWRKEFLTRLVDAAPKFWVVFETRPEYLDREDIELLSHLKVEIQFGVESCSPEILLLMRKTRQPQKFLENFRETSHLLSEKGVLHRANLIFNHPGETRRTLEETFSFIDRELANKGTSLMWATHVYMHFPGCELDVNRQYYEEKYGARFLRPEWWKGTDDQYEASMDCDPSGDLQGENRHLWKRMQDERTNAMKAALTPMAFKFAAAKYYPDWKSDPDYA